MRRRGTVRRRTPVDAESVGLVSGALIKADRRGGSDIEAFCAAGIGMRTRGVGQIRDFRGRPWASGPNSHAVGTASSASSRLTSPVERGRQHLQAGFSDGRHAADGVGLADHRNRENTSRRGAQALAVVGVDAVPGQHHRIRAHRVGDADQGARVSGFGDPHRRPRRSVGPAASTSVRPASGIAHTATSPTGVTVSDNAFAARSVTRCTGAPASSVAEPFLRRLGGEHLRRRPRAATRPRRGWAPRQGSVRRGGVRRGGAV